MTKKHDPYQGKYTVKSLLRQTKKNHGGDMPVEDLLNQMKRKGYFKEPLRRRLCILDVEVVNGVVKLIG